MAAAVLAATVEIERAPFFAITVYIFVPAIAIGLWQRLGFRGILVEVVPSWLFVFLMWAEPVPAMPNFWMFAFLAAILAGLLLWAALAAAPGGSRLRALSDSALWGILSMLCSNILRQLSVIAAMMIDHVR